MFVKTGRFSFLTKHYHTLTCHGRFNFDNLSCLTTSMQLICRLSSFIKQDSTNKGAPGAHQESFTIESNSDLATLIAVK